MKTETVRGLKVCWSTSTFVRHCTHFPFKQSIKESREGRDEKTVRKVVNCLEKSWKGQT